jgi:hypothetical protein
MMTKKPFGLLYGLMLSLVGVALLLYGWLYATHHQLLRRADALAAAGDFRAALHAYEEAEARYTTTFWGVPQGPLLTWLDQLGFDARSYTRWRRAEMAFREGARLLRATNGAVKPPLDIVRRLFQTAAVQYKAAWEHSAEPYERFLASANHAQALVQSFFIDAFLAEPPRDPLNLKQGLVRAIKALQSALDALYTEHVQASFMEERSLVLQLETLTRFHQTPDAEAEQQRRVERFFQDAAPVPEVVPFGEMLRSSDLQSFSPEAEETMRAFLLQPSPSTAAREPLDRSRQGARTGLGGADAGSAGSMH